MSIGSRQRAAAHMLVPFKGIVLHSIIILAAQACHEMQLVHRAPCI